jgi:hypothetical protein
MTIAAALMMSSGCIEDLHQPGIMLNGKITPCHGSHTDIYACGAATFNAPRVAQIQSGMTIADVRKLMEHDPERRTMEGRMESWAYITDYDAEMMTWITFTDDVVTGMRQGPWKTE